MSKFQWLNKKELIKVLWVCSPPPIAVVSVWLRDAQCLVSWQCYPTLSTWWPQRGEREGWRGQYHIPKCIDSPVAKLLTFHSLHLFIHPCLPAKRPREFNHPHWVEAKPKEDEHQTSTVIKRIVLCLLSKTCWIPVCLWLYARFFPLPLPLSLTYFPSSCDEIPYPTQPNRERVCFVSQIEGTVHYSGSVLAAQNGHNESTVKCTQKMAACSQLPFSFFTGSQSREWCHL